LRLDRQDRRHAIGYPLDTAFVKLHTSVMGAEGDLAALASQLRDDLGFRRIEQGLQRLERSRQVIDAVSARTQNAGVLVGLLAQWVDAGFDGPDLISRLLTTFPKTVRPTLPLLDYLHLRMAEGVVLMASEDFDGASEHFRFVQSLEGEVEDAELFAIANFWTGRCLRKTGRYDDALNYTARGEELALSCGYGPMAAIMQVTRSWLAFQKGKLSEASAILRSAEQALSGTDDFVSRGNIHSAHGRIARRQGRYEQAVELFERAIGEYSSGARGQLQLARTLLNLSFVKRLLALQQQKDLDRASASRRSAREDAASGADTPREQRLVIERLRAEAKVHLSEAMAIYARHGNHRGIAGAHINKGFLDLDSGDLECAAREGAEAFRYGQEKRDYIVMARARTLQCITEYTALEEQVGNPARHHEAAEAFAREAVDFAGRTQNRRLLARACVWQGLTYTAEPYRDEEAARRCCEQAIALLQPEGVERQYLWEDLATLRTRVLHAKLVDPTLRAWSAGVVHGKTFQQVTEEFARIIIPKVWEREGRKVSRVAQKLSISPKKVRRILHAAGLRDSTAAGRPEPGADGSS
jgi:tetratricopeptide (TPR) repeat protein